MNDLNEFACCGGYFGQRHLSTCAKGHPAPPSIALAMMAWKLAGAQAMIVRARPQGPQPRAALDMEPASFFPVSRGYYRILDRLSAGEQP